MMLRGKFFREFFFEDRKRTAEIAKIRTRKNVVPHGAKPNWNLETLFSMESEKQQNPDKNH